MRDLRARETQLVSRAERRRRPGSASHPAISGDGGNRHLGPTKGSSTRSDALITLLRA